MGGGRTGRARGKSLGASRPSDANNTAPARRPNVGLPRAHIEALFVRYDVNANGRLDPSEVQALARDVLEHIPFLFRESVRREFPDIPNDRLNALVQSERPNILPGTELQVTRYLTDTLAAGSAASAGSVSVAASSSGSGGGSASGSSAVITSESFVHRWNSAAEVMFAALRDRPISNMKCTIL